MAPATDPQPRGRCSAERSESNPAPSRVDQHGAIGIAAEAVQPPGPMTHHCDSAQLSTTYTAIRIRSSVSCAAADRRACFRPADFPPGKTHDLL